MTKHQADEIDRVRAIKERHVEALRGYANVTGVGVGFKEVAGSTTGTIAIRVYVRHKIRREDLRPQDLLPREIDGVPIDVIEGDFVIHDAPADHRVRHQLLHGGISVGNALLGGSGTLGCTVFDLRSGMQLLLSNWHVLCGRRDCRVGEPIIQPGTGGGDPGRARDVVARLHRWALDDRVDAAVAVLSGERFLGRDLLGLGMVYGPREATLGMRVRKSGRTTGVTTAMITDVSANIDVDYRPELDETRHLRDQIVLKDGSTVSQRGDSGSVWIADDNRVVGLNFAGSDSLGIANPIAAVMEALAIGFDGSTLLDQLVEQALDP
jgi:hypothetical protein